VIDYASPKPFIVERLRNTQSSHIEAVQAEVDRNNSHVVCRTCGHRYAVRNGIVDALVPNPAIESERKGNLRLVTENRRCLAPGAARDFCGTRTETRQPRCLQRSG